MTLEPTFEEQELLADTRRRAVAAMTNRELIANLVVVLGFVAAVAGLFWLGSPQPLNPVAAALSVAVMVVAIRVRFETPFGFTVATQLAFVPMLFAMPSALVPVAVTAALAISALPGIVTGRAPLQRLLGCPANAWFSVGPALVFTIAGARPDASGAALLLVALVAQFSVDFGAAAVYLKVAREATLRSQLRDSWVYVIDAALTTVALAVAEEIRTAPYAVLAVVPLLGLLAMFANERRERLGKLLELNDTYRGTALLLGDVISADDGYTGEHSEGVVGLALAVADALGLVTPDLQLARVYYTTMGDAEARRNLEFGAMLHDVGKIAVPKEIINKPGKLDADEWAIIKTHPEVGERMLNRVGGFMVEVGKIVRHHHERWDGGGYPDGLVAEESSLESRIIVCCDSWSAMRTDRSYRAAMSYDAAVEQMTENAGTQFDPVVVEAMLQVVAASEGAVVAGADDEAVVVPVEAEDVRRADVAGHSQRAPEGALA